MSNEVERERANERDRARVRQRKEQGLCVKCGKPRGEGGTATLCAVHAGKARVGHRARRVRWVAQGRCATCGKSREKSGTATLCDACATDMRARQKGRQTQRIAQGLCVDCGQPNNGTARCDTCAEKQYALNKKISRRWFEQGVCPWHKTEMRKLPRCPACLYKTEEQSLSFRGLMPPPQAGDRLEACVGCEDCGRVYHEGGSYSAPRHRQGMERNDEHVGAEGAGVWLLYSLGKDEQDGILALYERCSIPDDPCVGPIAKGTADWYLWLRRAGRDDEVSGICWEHSRDPVALSERVAAKSQSGDGQKNEGAEKRGRGRTPKSPEVKQAELTRRKAEFEDKIRELGRRLEPYEITRAIIADEYASDDGEIPDDSTVSKWVLEFYGKGVSVPAAVNRILAGSRINIDFERENKSPI